MKLPAVWMAIALIVTVLTMLGVFVDPSWGWVVAALVAASHFGAEEGKP